MENQKSMWWPVALLAFVMLISIIAGTYSLLYFIGGSVVWIILLVVIIAITEARHGHSHAAQPTAAN